MEIYNTILIKIVEKTATDEDVKKVISSIKNIKEFLDKLTEYLRNPKDVEILKEVLLKKYKSPETKISELTALLKSEQKKNKSL